MCGRFSLSTPIADLADLFDADADGLVRTPARFNLAPTETVVAVRAEGGKRRLVGLRWGLIPNWVSQPGSLPLMINARAESLGARPAFRDLLPRRRCVVPADGFYEWRTEGGRRQPYFVRARDGAPLALAAIWDAWRGEGAPIESCAIITTDANSLLRALHDRMPAIVAGDGLDAWLDPATGYTGDLERSLRPFDPARLEVFPVSARVNRVGVDDLSCVEPLDPPIRAENEWSRRPRAGSAGPEQLGLF